jgi:hypothetical protein
MIPNRESTATTSNRELHEVPAAEQESNRAWFERIPNKDGIILLGGTSLGDFRLRVAQARLRGDLTPSYWSLCGLLLDEEGRFLSVPLQSRDLADVPGTNAVRTLTLDEFDDPKLWPNIAVLRFAASSETVIAKASIIARRRSLIDLPRLLVRWLAYAWAADDGADPLGEGNGVPSAAFVEAAYALADMELTPGLSSSASCPEAIWQAVKWWHEYYEGTSDLGTARESGPIVPEGVYAVRQRSAAMLLPSDPPITPGAPVGDAVPLTGSTATSVALEASTPPVTGSPTAPEASEGTTA